MSFPNLSGFLSLAGLLSAAAAFPVHAQTTGESPRPVRLNLVAVDSGGRPVPDLTATDVAVFDDGSRQQNVSLRLNQSEQPHPVVILFDLLNASESSRGNVWHAAKISLSHLTSTDPVYLYLLVEDGSLYPVHALPVAGAQSVADESWIKGIGPLIDAAMRKVNQLKPEDLRASSPVAMGERFKVTSRALDEMRALMATSRGPKELLWITYGISSNIRLVDDTWFDGTPFLRQLGTRFVQSDITVYTADPGMNLQRGILDRDSLDILTGATGGHAYATIDLTRAVTQIEAGARTNYSIEYLPAAKNWDGKYHKLRVTVARKGVHLQTEAGYYAVSGS